LYRRACLFAQAVCDTTTVKHSSSSAHSLTGRIARTHGVHTRVYSGDALGYRCMRVRQRSTYVVDMQMSTIALPSADATDLAMCAGDSVYRDARWTAMAGMQRRQRRTLTHVYSCQRWPVDDGRAAVRARRRLQHSAN
jgi:hypothetical protein